MKNVKTLTDIFVKVMFDALFFIVYGVLIIALGLVLLVRGLYVWIYTMFSPIFGLMYFFEKKETKGKTLFDQMNIQTFISLALVPVYSMLALSF